VSVNPNPWIETATISYFVPESGPGRLEFYNVSGQLLYSEIRDYKQGQQSMLITKDELGAQGVIYVKLTTVAGKAEYKMMIVE